MAAHLLRRTIGPTIEEINQSVSDGLDVTISKLLDQTPVSFDPPINYLDDEDNEVPLVVPGLMQKKKKRFQEEKIVLCVEGKSNS